MTLRAGMYNASPPVWRGVLRESSFPAYVCVHNHHADTKAATKCAQDALAQVKAGNTLPSGWVAWERGMPAS